MHHTRATHTRSPSLSLRRQGFHRFQSGGGPGRQHPGDEADQHRDRFREDHVQRSDLSGKSGHDDLNDTNHGETHQQSPEASQARQQDRFAEEQL